MFAAMTDTLEPFEKPALTHRRYLLAGQSILIPASDGYVGWQRRATANPAAANAASQLCILRDGRYAASSR
jgi:hypothetical protein